jgi:hypothetical protein
MVFMNIIYYYLLLSLRNIGFVVIGNDLHQVRCKHRSARPYKRAFDHQEALSILADGKSRHFDPQLLDVFMSISDIMLTYSEQWKDV